MWVIFSFFLLLPLYRPRAGIVQRIRSNIQERIHNTSEYCTYKIVGATEENEFSPAPSKVQYFIRLRIIAKGDGILPFVRMNESMNESVL